MTSPNTDAMAQESTPGTRDDLIEALAKARHKNWSWDVQEANSWPCEFCRARTEDIVDTDSGWAVVVKFVAEWLESLHEKRVDDLFSFDPEDWGLVFAERWREEMS